MISKENDTQVERQQEFQAKIYFYPNEVDLLWEDGERVAYLKPNWQEIRKTNIGNKIEEFAFSVTDRD